MKVNKTVTDVVETRAIFSSVLDVLGLPSPLPDEGAPPSLLPMMHAAQPGGNVTTRETSGSSKGIAYSSVWIPEPGLGEHHVMLSCLRTARWKLIHDHRHDQKHLFDLSVDPWETDDVASQHPEKSAEMNYQLDEWWRQMERHGAEIPRYRQSPDELEKLKSLGYL